MRHIDQATRVLRAVVIVAVPLWIGACADDPPTGPGQSEIQLLTLAAIVSDPRAAFGQQLAAQPSAAAVASAVNVVYVSLPPESVERGSTVEIRNLTTGFTRTDPLVDGGLDPVAVPAVVGDTLELKVRDGGEVTVYARAIVRPRSPPRVVRTVPPPKKRDVALNSQIQVVFSEPMDSNTITTTTVQLLRNSTPVAGRVVVSADGLRADFVPDSLLIRVTPYTLVVESAAADLAGDALEEPLTTDFTTADQSGAASPASVTITPGSAALAAFAKDSARYVGALVLLTATVRDTSGAPLSGRRVVWTTSDTVVAQFRGLGTDGNTNIYVEGEAPGSATITATAEGVSGTSRITVHRAMVEPATRSVRVGESVELVATVRDTAGRVQSGWTAGWSSSSPGTLQVDPISSNSARATGRAAGIERIQISLGRDGVLLPGYQPGLGFVTISVSTGIPVASVSLAPDTVRTVPGARNILLRVTVRDSNGATTYAPVTWCRAPDGTWLPNCGNLDTQSFGLAWNEARLSAGVPGTASTAIATAAGISDTTVVITDYITIAALSPWDGEVPYGMWGASGFCALTSGGEVYCAGDNGFPLGYGLLGASDYTGPVAVVGGLKFTAISSSSGHRCALTATGTAYCWGLGYLGQLGTDAQLEPCDGITGDGGIPIIGCSSRPVPVTGGQNFTQITTSVSHSCALTPGGAAYCWGYNLWGQLGDRTTTSRSTPVAVAGGLTFTQINTAGATRTCALTSGGLAYCWGLDAAGELGNSAVPVAVGGNLTFSLIDGNCGLASDGAAYCFEAGTNSLTPVPVAPGFTFTDLRAGGSQSCGLTRIGEVYCWGWYDDGTDNWPFVGPTLLRGGLTFASLSPDGGNSYGVSCGMTTSGVTYCWTLLGEPRKL